MVLKVRAIKSNTAAVNDNAGQIESAIARELGAVGVAGDLIRTMADYPSQMPTKSGYVRQGDLGRGWRMKLLARRHGAIWSETVNEVIYAGRVQGRKSGPKGPGTQTKEMKRRRWISIETGVKRVWPKHRRTLIRILGQTDSRMRARRRRFR